MTHQENELIKKYFSKKDQSYITSFITLMLLSGWELHIPMESLYHFEKENLRVKMIIDAYPKYKGKFRNYIRFSTIDTDGKLRGTINSMGNLNTEESIQKFLDSI